VKIGLFFDHYQKRNSNPNPQKTTLLLLFEIFGFGVLFLKNDFILGVFVFSRYYY